MVVGTEKVILNQHFELRIGYLSHIVTGKLFLGKFHDAIAEATKALVPYFEVLHLGFIKRPYDANLVFCSCVLDTRMKTCEKIWRSLTTNIYRSTNNYIMRLDQKT